MESHINLLDAVFIKNLEFCTDEINTCKATHKMPLHLKPILSNKNSQNTCLIALFS